MWNRLRIVDANIAPRNQRVCPRRVSLNERQQLDPRQVRVHVVRPMHCQAERKPVHEPTVVVVGARFGASRRKPLVCLERERIPEQERDHDQHRKHAGDQPDGADVEQNGQEH